MVKIVHLFAWVVENHWNFLSIIDLIFFVCVEMAWTIVDDEAEWNIFNKVIFILVLIFETWTMNITSHAEVCNNEFYTRKKYF